MSASLATPRCFAERLAAKIFRAFSNRFHRAFRSRESGYAFIMVLFMVLIVIIGSSEAALRLSTEGRRTREEEAIWRGQQYVRAIRLYYRKTGHFPQNTEDLQKGLPELHFLRLEAYKDPLNSADGAWRFIYVNGSGAIIGSTRYASLQQMAIMDMNGGKIPGAPEQSGDSSSSDTNSSSNSSSASASASSTGADSQNSTAQGTGPNASPSSSGGGSSTSGGNSSGPNSSPTDSSTAAGQSSSPNNSFNPGANPPTNPGANPLAAGLSVGVVNTAALAAMKPTGPVSGPVVGGFLIGVGSTIDQRSQKVYNTAKKYSDWEFIWNPIEEQARAMQGGGQGTPGALGQPSGTPLSGSSPLPSPLQQQQQQSQPSPSSTQP